MTGVFHPHNRQRGFTLIVALFILVVLAVFGTYLLSMATVQSMNSVLALKGAQAYQAACSGIEWGIARAATGNCAAATSFSVTGTDFTVRVSCQAQGFSEGGSSFSVYSLTAVAEAGTYGDEDYVARRVETRVTGP